VKPLAIIAVKTEFLPKFRTTDLDKQFAGYILDYVRLSHSGLIRSVAERHRSVKFSHV
jgi:hypothetical protein